MLILWISSLYWETGLMRKLFLVSGYCFKKAFNPEKVFLFSFHTKFILILA